MKNEEQNKLLEKIYSSCPDSISYKDYNFKYQLVNDVMSEKICKKNLKTMDYFAEIYNFVNVINTKT